MSYVFSYWRQELTKKVDANSDGPDKNLWRPSTFTFMYLLYDSYIKVMGRSYDDYFLYEHFRQDQSSTEKV